MSVQSIKSVGYSDKKPETTKEPKKVVVYEKNNTIVSVPEGTPKEDYETIIKAVQGNLRTIDYA